MAKNTQPIAKRCKALGISPTVMGYSKKETNRNPGGQMRKKKSEYALQLTEKQKVKFVYGILEKQFRSYYEKATRMSGKTGENLLILVERRLDNVVYRLGFASTRRDARQLVNHGHFTVNGIIWSTTRRSSALRQGDRYPHEQALQRQRPSKNSFHAPANEARLPSEHLRRSAC